jgi:hypothetical protein
MNTVGAVWMIAGIIDRAIRTRGFRAESVAFELPSDLE